MPFCKDCSSIYQSHETRNIHPDWGGTCSCSPAWIPGWSEMPEEWRRRDSNTQGGHIGHPGHNKGHRADFCDKEGGGFHPLSGDRHPAVERHPLCDPGEGADTMGGLPVCGLCLRGDAPGGFSHLPHRESDHNQGYPGHQENQVGTWSPRRIWYQ